MSADGAFDPAEYERLLRHFGIDQYRRRGRKESHSLLAYKALRAEQDRAFSRRMVESAERLAAEGREREAVEEFSRAIGFCETAEALLGRAAVYLSQRSFDRCTADYNRVLEIDPSNQVALRYFGNIREANATSLHTMPQRRRAEKGAARGDDGLQPAAQGEREGESDSASSESTPSHRHRKRKREKKHKKKHKKKKKKKKRKSEDFSRRSESDG